MSSFVWNGFPLIVPRRGPEIRKCISSWISGARTYPTPPPMCFYDEPDQSYNVTLLPFILDTNLWPSTVLLFMLLHQLIVMPLLPRQSMTPPFYAIASLNCNAFFVPPIYMTLYGTPFYAIVPINCNAFVTPPIYDSLRYSFLCYCIIVLQCIILPHQSMTLYGIPFYAIASLYDILLKLSELDLNFAELKQNWLS